MPIFSIFLRSLLFLFFFFFLRVCSTSPQGPFPQSSTNTSKINVREIINDQKTGRLHNFYFKLGTHFVLKWTFLNLKLDNRHFRKRTGNSSQANPKFEYTLSNWRWVKTILLKRKIHTCRECEQHGELGARQSIGRNTLAVQVAHRTRPLRMAHPVHAPISQCGPLSRHGPKVSIENSPLQSVSWKNIYIARINTNIQLFNLKQYFWVCSWGS